MQQHSVILFDGVCNYCNRMVRFVISQDKKDALRFAPLQSEAGERLLKQFNIHEQDFSSFLLIENDQVWMRSAAALMVLKRLPWYWKWTQLFWIVPEAVRDGVYNYIASHRYKWFGKAAQCMVPAPDVRSKFLK